MQALLAPPDGAGNAGDEASDTLNVMLGLAAPNRTPKKNSVVRWEGKSGNHADVILGLVPRICNVLILFDVFRSSGQARG